jgi:2-polyprenyl-6-methoxyphenol hydroxylase-like FAD-dependent oxidoreductase
VSGSWDVVVVGARVAGAATAMLLARAGLRVLVVDRARRGSDTLSTHALMRGGTLQLQRWGVLDAVIAAGTPPVRRIVFHYGDESVPVTLRPAAGVTALYAPRRPLLDALLANEATRAGATVTFGTAVTGLVREQGRIAGVVLRERSGATRCERAGLVIGADGRRSAVAAAVRAGTLLAGTVAGRVRYGYWRDLDTAGYEWFYAPGRTAGAIPTNDELTCVFIGAPDPGVSDPCRPGVNTFVPPASLADRLASARRVGQERVVPGQPGVLRQAWGPGWALVGDAGYWKDPLSTHGMTDALRDAELLARAVAAAPRPGAEQHRALAGYQAVRDRLSLPMMDVVEQIASYSWDLPEVQRLLRVLASVMTDEVEELASLEPAA